MTSEPTDAATALEAAVEEARDAYGVAYCDPGATPHAIHVAWARYVLAADAAGIEIGRDECAFPDERAFPE
jgi:hypothetical protein